MESSIIHSHLHTVAPWQDVQGSPHKSSIQPDRLPMPRLLCLSHRHPYLYIVALICCRIGWPKAHGRLEAPQPKVAFHVQSPQSVKRKMLERWVVGRLLVDELRYSIVDVLRVQLEYVDALSTMSYESPAPMSYDRLVEELAHMVEVEEVVRRAMLQNELQKPRLHQRDVSERCHVLGDGGGDQQRFALRA